MNSYSWYYFALYLAFLFVSVVQSTQSSASPYPLSPLVLPLRRKQSSFPSKLFKRDPLETLPVRIGASYLIDITFGGTTTLPITLDTGSSDLWVVTSNFTCIDYSTGKPTSESDCQIPRTYTPGTNFSHLNSYYNITYADGEYVTGKTGLDSISIAGLNIPEQRIGVVDEVYWLTGDGYSAGVVGFGFFATPNAITSKTIAQDSSSDNTINNPIFTSLYSASIIPPIFSLALNRAQGLSGGILALGGIPPSVSYTAPFVHIPLENPRGIIPRPDDAQDQIYQFTVSGTTFTPPSSSAAVTNRTSYQITLDSGTPATYLPLTTVHAINSAFDPPGTDIGGGIYSLDCGAKVPKVAIIIGDRAFYMSSADLVDDDGAGSCSSNIISGDSDGGSDYILGGVFLNNVLAVFDVGNATVGIAAREESVDVGPGPAVTTSATAGGTAVETIGSSPTSSSTAESNGNSGGGGNSSPRQKSSSSPAKGSLILDFGFVSILALML
jgi:hypothetical protein